jgi:hypothetical protein
MQCTQAVGQQTPAGTVNSRRCPLQLCPAHACMPACTAPLFKQLLDSNADPCMPGYLVGCGSHHVCTYAAVWRGIRPSIPPCPRMPRGAGASAQLCKAAIHHTLSFNCISRVGRSTLGWRCSGGGCSTAGAATLCGHVGPHVGIRRGPAMVGRPSLAGAAARLALCAAPEQKNRGWCICSMAHQSRGPLTIDCS